VHRRTTFATPSRSRNGRFVAGGRYFGECADAPPRGPAEAWHPVGMTVIGLGGLAVILWLMVFKPF
jgi:hypothetical protein